MSTPVIIADAVLAILCVVLTVILHRDIVEISKGMKK